MPNFFTLRRLNPDETRPHFDCGDDDLNEFFASDSTVADKQLLSVTYVAEREDAVIAFFSVSNASIRRSDLPKSKVKKFPQRKRYKNMPAVNIARFATAHHLQSQKIGTDLLDFIKVWFVKGNKTGCRFIIVDAYNKPRTIHFYQKNNFVFLIPSDKDEETRLMYFDLITFRK